LEIGLVGIAMWLQNVGPGPQAASWFPARPYVASMNVVGLML
jgi:hypothetical protein